MNRKGKAAHKNEMSTSLQRAKHKIWGDKGGQKHPSAETTFSKRRARGRTKGKPTKNRRRGALPANPSIRV